jgi:hypothetical protein
LRRGERYRSQIYDVDGIGLASLDFPADGVLGVLTGTGRFQNSAESGVGQRWGLDAMASASLTHPRLAADRMPSCFL